MDFDEIFKSVILTEEGILELVDEYTLYCYYTGIDPLIPGKAYQAPYYRLDNFPSFSIFESKKHSVDYMWKDHATGESGSIFKLIQKIERLDNKQQVLARINEDFELGYNTTAPVRKEKIVWYEKPIQGVIKIRVTPKPFTLKGKQFWDNLFITQEVLDLYNVGQVEYFWTYNDQQAPTTAPDPMFYYRIGNFYQLYAPFVGKKYKFRNDLPENYFFGYPQLPKTGEKLIIDKSCKDVMFCHKLGLPAVAGKSETTMIPEKKMIELKDRFSTIYLMLDNDTAGRNQTEKYKQLYPWLQVRFLTEAKDKSDLCKAVGFEDASKIIHQLTQC